MLAQGGLRHTLWAAGREGEEGETEQRMGERQMGRRRKKRRKIEKTWV